MSLRFSAVCCPECDRITTSFTGRCARCGCFLRPYEPPDPPWPRRRPVSGETPADCTKKGSGESQPGAILDGALAKGNPV